MHRYLHGDGESLRSAAVSKTEQDRKSVVNGWSQSRPQSRQTDITHQSTVVCLTGCSFITINQLQPLLVRLNPPT